MHRTCFHCHWFESVNSIKKLNKGTVVVCVFFAHPNWSKFERRCHFRLHKISGWTQKRLCKRVGGNMIWHFNARGSQWCVEWLKALTFSAYVAPNDILSNIKRTYFVEECALKLFFSFILTIIKLKQWEGKLLLIMIFFNRSFLLELIIISAIVTKQPISMIIFGFAQYLDVIDCICLLS